MTCLCFIIEPVLSTGVYIHPSGYSYTVAPNGVWYFHNADGSPPTTAPGTPPMAYTPTTMQKIQASQTSPKSTSASNKIENSIEAGKENGMPEGQTLTTTHSTVPIYHGIPPDLSQQVNPELSYQVYFPMKPNNDIKLDINKKSIKLKPVKSFLI